MALCHPDDLFVFECEFRFGLKAEFLHQPCRRAEAGERALETVESDKQGEPCPVRVVEQGKQAGQHDHDAAEGE